MATRVGLCGAGVALQKYAATFSVLEVQQTFYEPPQPATLRRWRSCVLPEFEFTIKAWQLITHEARSSTYRRLRTSLTQPGTRRRGFVPLDVRRAAGLGSDTAVRSGVARHSGAVAVPGEFPAHR